MTHTPDHNPADGPGSPMDPRELAELYAAGALEPAEAAAFERRLSAHEPEIVAAYDTVRPSLDSLLAAEPIQPPARIRSEVLARIDSADAANRDQDDEPLWSDDELHHHHDEEADLVGAGAGRAAGIVIARAATGRWRRTGVPGVRYQPLYSGRGANRRTILLNMEPGSSLPDHDHAGDEEVIMISGDLSIGGTTLGPGDYIRIAPGARHGVPRTANGCICVVVSSYVPFPLSSWPRFVWTALKGLFSRPNKARGREPR